MFLALLASVLAYLIPSAIVSCDISIAYPMDGGLVSWIDVALGPVVGLQNMYWFWANNVLNAAIYPVLAGYYIVDAVGQSTGPSHAFYAQMIVLLCVISRLFDFGNLSRVSLVLTIIALTPTLLYIAFAFKYIKPSSWTDTSGDYNCSTVSSNGTYMHDDDTYYEGGGMCTMPLNWGNLLSYALWEWCGFFNIGTVSDYIIHVPLILLIHTS